MSSLNSYTSTCTCQKGGTVLIMIIINVIFILQIMSQWTQSLINLTTQYYMRGIKRSCTQTEHAKKWKLLLIYYTCLWILV